jgi:hypothetical protein
VSQSVLAILTTKSRHLEPSKRNLTINSDGAVNLHSSGVKLFRNSHCTIDILSKHGGREAKVGIVCASNSFILSLESINNDDRTEDLLLIDCSIRFSVGEDSWLEIETLGLVVVEGYLIANWLAASE